MYYCIVFIDRRLLTIFCFEFVLASTRWRNKILFDSRATTPLVEYWIAQHRKFLFGRICHQTTRSPVSSPPPGFISIKIRSVLFSWAEIIGYLYTKTNFLRGRRWINESRIKPNGQTVSETPIIIDSERGSGNNASRSFTRKTKNRFGLKSAVPWPHRFHYKYK